MKRLRPLLFVLPVLAACGGGQTHTSSARETDVPPPALARACEDRLATIGDDSAPAADPREARGEVVRCALQHRVSEADLQARGATRPGGMHVLRISYRTTRGDDSPAVATARVYLPDVIDQSPAPMVVIAHETVGIADACAPSNSNQVFNDLVQPWLTHGWIAIAPDYAGLGGPGTQGYGDGHDTGRSVLDAARALRALLPQGTLSDDIVMVGHSQGGGAVISAQGLASHYDPGGTIRVVLPIAPGWPVATNVDAYFDLRNPDASMRGGDELSAVIGALFFYSWHARRFGEDHGGDGFSEGSRARLVRALQSECVGSLLQSIPRAAPTLGDLIDDEFRRGILECVYENRCEGRPGDFVEYVIGNILHGDPRGAPIVILQGRDDGIITQPRTQCVVDHLHDDGMEPDVCIMDGGHMTVVPGANERAVEIAELVIAGQQPPSCGDSLPECSQR